MPHVLNGQTVRRPNTYARTGDPVELDVLVASGRGVRYSRGVRRRWAMSWRNLKAADVAPLEGLPRGPFAFADEVLGATATVLVDGVPAIVAVAGTSPVRYDVDLALVEQAAR